VVDRVWERIRRPVIGFSGVGMCEQCEELDKKISHYRKLAGSLTDEPTLRGIKMLIERMEARKKTLHPDQPEG
jgi:hypothetical protein